LKDGHVFHMNNHIDFLLVNTCVAREADTV
jgi:hypothetical protein